MSELKKRGRVVISAGKYEKDGKEKTRYAEVGTYFATDHNGKMAIKMHATAFSDEKWLNIYLDDNQDSTEPENEPQGKYDRDIETVKAIAMAKEEFTPNNIDDKPINLSELNIPF